MLLPENDRIFRHKTGTDLSIYLWISLSFGRSPILRLLSSYRCKTVVVVVVYVSGPGV